MLTYSNPRTSATFDDWPFGRLRTSCAFHIETAGPRGHLLNGREVEFCRATRMWAYTDGTGYAYGAHS